MCGRWRAAGCLFPTSGLVLKGDCRQFCAFTHSPPTRGDIYSQLPRTANKFNRQLLPYTGFPLAFHGEHPTWTKHSVAKATPQRNTNFRKSPFLPAQRRCASPLAAYAHKGANHELPRSQKCRANRKNGRASSTIRRTPPQGIFLCNAFRSVVQ